MYNAAKLAGKAEMLEAYQNVKVWLGNNKYKFLRKHEFFNVF